MDLDKLTIKNFRQFYGEQYIYFSRDKNKNVTVIHGDNGSGKTALLNSFSWVLYGEVNLPHPNRFLNEKKEAELNVEDTTQVLVELSFRDNSKEYTITRFIDYKKTNEGLVSLNGDGELKMQYIAETGETHTPSNPQNAIDQILPQRLRSYFFFDGEHINQLAKEDSSEEIKDAIKNIMGLEVLERAKRHIKSAKRNFRKEMEKHENSDELAELNDEQSKYEDNIMQYEDDIRQLKTNKDAANRQLEEINNQLRSKETTSDLQNKRDELEIEKKNNSKELAELKEKICSSISVNGSLALANKVLNESSNFLSDKIDSGEIPAGIKKVFVNELLEREECICGSPLCEGTQEREEVKSWLEKAGDNKLEKIFIDINTMIGTLNERKENFYENLEKLKNNREILKEKRRKIFEKIDEIESELSQKDSEDIQELLKKKNDINENIESISRDIGAFEQKIRDNEKELKDIEKKIEKFEAKKEKSILAQKRVFALNNANKYIEYLHEKNANKVRKKVQDKIKEVFKEFFRKNYSPVLDENYNLRIVKSFSNEERSVPMSRGERQITSISFIGSLVDIAREHMKESSNDLFYTGGIYPIVMDSPFGALDPDHKKRIATGIPSLAKQVIVMATDSQWQDEVNDSMRNKVGEEYFLNNFDPNLDENIENEFTLIERE